MTLLAQMAVGVILLALMVLILGAMGYALMDKETLGTRPNANGSEGRSRT